MDNKRYVLWINKFLMLASPAFCYVIFEWITGNLFYIRGEFILWNLLFYYTIYFLLFGITGGMRFSYLLLNLLFTVLATAEYFVIVFRSRPIMIWDIMAWRTAVTVAGNYTYSVKPHLVFGILAMVLFSVLIWKKPFVLKKGKARFLLPAGAVSWTVCWTALFFWVVVPARSIDVSMWNPTDTYETRGYMLCTARLVGYIRVNKPEEYQENVVAQLYEELQGADPKGTVQPVNIICIMNESWADLTNIAPFETDRECFAYYNSMDINCTKGKVCVPVFGAGTSNSEYEFLTGNSIAFAPTGSVPFQIYMKHHTPSIIDSVKNQGYYTIAMHPYVRNNWNRIEAYTSLGFDEFLSIESFEDAETIRGYVSDKSCYEKIIYMTEEQEGENPTFYYLVTMQNHGGYNLDYESTVHLTEYEDYPLTEQFLSVMRETDLALEYLIEYYKQSDQPTLIMMFGDHLPGLEEGFYGALDERLTALSQPKNMLSHYETPFFIWTNYENDMEDQADFSLLYLGSQVLKAANLSLNGYENFLDDLKNRVPMIHFMGYYDEERTWQSWTNWRTKDSYQWLQSFEWFQYYRMFGNAVS